MNVLVNALVTPPQPVGVGNYIRGILNQFGKDFKEVHFFVLVHRESEAFAEDSYSNASLIRVPFAYNSVVKRHFHEFLWLQKNIGSLITEHKIDIFFHPNTFLLPKIPIPVVVTIHDLLELDTDAYSWLKRIYRRLVLRQLCKRASHIVTVSQFSRTRLLHHYRPKCPISVIHPIFRFDFQDMKNKSFELPDTPPFLLFIGNHRPYKGLSVLLEAYFQSGVYNEGISLALAGNIDQESVNTMVSDPDLHKHLLIYGYISDEMLRQLLAKCMALISPSTYEGFGLPVIEAMGFGKPVILSDIEVYRELFGFAGIFFEPNNFHSLSGQLKSFVSSPQLQKEASEKSILAKESFSNFDSVRRLYEVFESVKKSTN